MNRPAAPLTPAGIPAPAAAPERARRLALAAVAGPVLFTLAWAVLGFLSPGYTIWDTRIEPYSPVSQPISGLGLGPTAPVMNAAFVLGGLLLIAGVAGVFGTIGDSGSPTARRAGAALLALSGVGLVIDGIFDLEKIIPHLLGFLLATSTPVLSFLVAGLLLRGIPGWRRFGSWLLLGSPLTLLLVVLFFLLFDPTAAGGNHGVAGLAQRLLALEVHAWFAAMGWLAFRRRRILSLPRSAVVVVRGAADEEPLPDDVENARSAST